MAAGFDFLQQFGLEFGESARKSRLPNAASSDSCCCVEAKPAQIVSIGECREPAGRRGLVAAPANDSLQHDQTEGETRCHPTSKCPARLTGCPCSQTNGAGPMAGSAGPRTTNACRDNIDETVRLFIRKGRSWPTSYASPSHRRSVAERSGAEPARTRPVGVLTDPSLSTSLRPPTWSAAPRHRTGNLARSGSPDRVTTASPSA